MLSTTIAGFMRRQPARLAPDPGISGAAPISSVSFARLAESLLAARCSLRHRAPIRVLIQIIVLGIMITGSPAEGRSSFLVVDAGSGRTLQAVGADTTHYPASLTKMMTLYLLFEALDRKQIKLNSQMRVSRTAAAKPPTELGLRPGQTISVNDAILAITTESANDMAALVGETLGGSETRFASRMTRKARALGMRRTTFGNASGLPHAAQRTTARDMVTLARALLRDYPHYYHYFGKRQFRYAGTTHPNHNRLLGVYPGMDGIKTGYTRASGYNLVASAKRDGKRLIGAVMGSSSAANRNQTMARLLDAGFRKTSVTDRRPGDAKKPDAPARSETKRRSGAKAGTAGNTTRIVASR